MNTGRPAQPAGKLIIDLVRLVTRWNNRQFPTRTRSNSLIRIHRIISRPCINGQELEYLNAEVYSCPVPNIGISPIAGITILCAQFGTDTNGLA